METALTVTEKTCLLCQSYPGCPIHLSMGRALEVFDDAGKKLKALYWVLPEVCGVFGNYREDEYVKSEKVEYGLLKKIVVAAEEGKIVAIGKICKNGAGSEIVSAFLQGIYDTPEVARAFTKDMNVVLTESLNRRPAVAPASHSP